MKYADQIPDHLQKGIRVESVGDLVDRLSQLPRDMPLTGMDSDALYVVVTHVWTGDDEYLACNIIDAERDNDD